MTERAQEQARPQDTAEFTKRELSKLERQEAMIIVRNMCILTTAEMLRHDGSEESNRAWDEGGVQIRSFIHEWEAAQNKKPRTIIDKGRIVAKRWWSTSRRRG